MVPARAIHHYDSDPADPSSISIKKGEAVSVLSSDAHWAVVETATGVRGSVPRQVLSEISQLVGPVAVSVETVRSTRDRTGFLVPDDNHKNDGTPILQQHSPSRAHSSTSRLQRPQSDACGVPILQQHSPSRAHSSTSRLQRPQSDARHNAAVSEGSNAASNVHDLHRELLVLQEAHRQEVHARAEQSVQLMSAVKRLEEKVDAECRQHAQDAQMQALFQHLQDLRAALGKEVQDRQLGDTSLCSQIANWRKEFAKQLDGLTSQLQAQVEERLVKAGDDLRNDLELAMQETHEALQSELVTYKGSLEGRLSKHSALHESHASLVTNVEQKMHDEVQQMLNNHRRENADMKAMISSIKYTKTQEAREDGVEILLKDTCSNLQQELTTLKLGVNETQKSVQDITADLTQQVEQRLGKVCTELRRDMGEQKALHESHACSIKELSHRMQSALQEDVTLDLTKKVNDLTSSLSAESGLRVQVQEQITKTCSDLRSDLEQTMSDMHTALQGELTHHREQLQQVSENHQEKHTELRNLVSCINHEHRAEASLAKEVQEQDFRSALNDMQSRWEVEILALKAGTCSGHGSLRDIVTGLSKQVESMVSASVEESAFRDHFENRLSKIHGDIHSDLEIGMKQAHESLQVQLAEHLKNTCDSMSEMQNELAAHKRSLEEKRGEQIDHASVLQSQVEEGLSKPAADVCSELEISMQQAHEALKVQLAEHLQSTSDKMSEMQEAHETLNCELLVQKQSLEGKLCEQIALHESHALSMDELEQRIRSELQTSCDAHNEKYANMTTLINCISQEHHAMSAQVEERLSKACGGMRSDAEITMREANAALRAELADHWNNSGDVISEMCRAHESLHCELASQKRSLEGKFGEQSALYEEHVSSMNRLESRLDTAMQNISGNHATNLRLQEELVGLKAVEDKKYSTLQDAVVNLTKQIDSLRSCFTDESDLRIKVEEQHGKALEELRSYVETAMRKAKETLHVQIADHLSRKSLPVVEQVNELATCASCLGQKVEDHNQLHKRHSSLMDELEQRLRDEMQQAADDQLAKHADVKKLISSMTHEQHLKRVEAEAVRQECQSLVKNTHSKLQSEMAKVRSGVDDSHVSLLGIVTDLTRQVDHLTASFAEEYALRVQVEDRLSTACDDLHSALRAGMTEGHAALRAELEEHTNQSGNMMSAVMGLTQQVHDLSYGFTQESQICTQAEARFGKACDELRCEVQVSLQEEYMAVQRELADHAKRGESMMSSVLEARETLQSELDIHKKSFEGKLCEHGALHHGHVSAMEELKQRMRSELQEASEQNPFHTTLSEELSAWKSGLNDDHSNLQGMVLSLTNHVEGLKSSFTQESQVCMQAETRLGKACDELRCEVQVSLQEERMAVQRELADHTTRGENMMSSVLEARETLQSELDIHKKSFEGKLCEHGALHHGHVSAIEELKQRMCQELQEASENNPSHTKFQEELLAWKSGVDDDHSRLQAIVNGVTQQVENLHSTVAQDSQVCVQAEARLGKACDDLRCQVHSTIEDQHAALQRELTDHTKQSESMMSAMLEARETFQSKLDIHKESFEVKLCEHGALHDGHASAIEELKQRMPNELQEVSKSDPSHTKLLEGPLALKSGVDDNPVHLQATVMGLRRQVDDLNYCITQESQVCMQAEESLRKTCDELRSEVHFTLQEQHAALSNEFTDHSKSSSSMLSRMQEAHEALRSEFAMHTRSPERKLGEHRALSEDHSSLDLSTSTGDQQYAECAGIVTDLTRQVDGIRSSLAKESALRAQEVQQVSNELHAKHSNLNDLMMSINDEYQAKHTSIVIDLTTQMNSLRSCLMQDSGLQSQMDERLSKVHVELRSDIETTLREQHSALHVELADHSKLSTSMMSSLQEAHEALKSEVTAYWRSLKGNFGKQHALHESHARSKKEIEHNRGNEHHENKSDPVIFSNSDRFKECNALHEDHALRLNKFEQAMHDELQHLSNDHWMKYADMKNEMKCINDQCLARHVKVEEACVEGLQSVLSTTGSRLQEEIGTVKDLTKQVDHLTSSFAEESGLRLDCEKRLSRACDELRTDLENAIREANQSLRIELDNHCKSREDGSADLQSEFASYKSQLDGKLGEHDALHDGHASAIRELELRFCKEMQHPLQELQQTSVGNPARQAEMQAKKAAARGPVTGAATDTPEHSREEKSWAKAMQAFSSAEALAKKVAKSQSQPMLATGGSLHGIPDALEKISGGSTPRQVAAVVQRQHSSPARLPASPVPVRRQSVLPGATLIRRIS